MKSEAVVSIPALRKLETISGVSLRFFGKIPGVDVVLERQEAMAALAPHHRQLLRNEGLGSYPFITAEQVHGNKIALVDETATFNDSPVSGVDGLITTQRGITLGIHVADCAPVWIAAKNGSAGALLHSGKRGTELGIVPEGIVMLCDLANLAPEDLIIIIGPCIRPPCYEVDFAATIRSQAASGGVTEIHDDRICTACHPDLYYSYRRECGLTGRMLATLTLLPL